MSKLTTFFAALALVAGSIAITPTVASAQHWHGGGGGLRGGGWRGGGWGYGGGWGWGYARPYYGPYPYYDDTPPPTCGYARVRVWRGGHWVFRRAWRCW
jgi:hypothetical protein